MQGGGVGKLKSMQGGEGPYLDDNLFLSDSHGDQCTSHGVVVCSHAGHQKGLHCLKGDGRYLAYNAKVNEAQPTILEHQKIACRSNSMLCCSVALTRAMKGNQARHCTPR